MEDVWYMRWRRASSSFLRACFSNSKLLGPAIGRLGPRAYRKERPLEGEVARLDVI